MIARPAALSQPARGDRPVAIVEPSAAFVEPPIAIVERRCYQPNPDGSLSALSSGPLCLSIPRLGLRSEAVLPALGPPGVADDSLVSAADDSRLWDGRRRYEAYKRVLGEILTQAENPDVGELLDGASGLLAGVTPEMTAGEAAALLIARAADLGQLRAGALVSAAETVVAAQKGPAAIDASLQNGGLRAVVLEALHMGFVLERAEVLRALARLTSLDADPVFRRAIEATVADLERRHPIRLQILRSVFRAALRSPDADLAAAAGLPVLPLPLARAAFPALAPRAIDRLGYGAEPRAQGQSDRPSDRGSTREGEADLVVLATLDDALFAGTSFDYGCGSGEDGGEPGGGAGEVPRAVQGTGEAPGRGSTDIRDIDRAERTAHEIRLYIAREFTRRLDDRHSIAGGSALLRRLDEALEACGRPVF